MKNKLKEQKETTEGTAKEKVSKKENKIARSIIDVLNGSFLSRDNVLKHLPYLFFLTFMVICYIGYGYYTDKTLREISQVDSELKELKSEYISSKSELSYMSKQSQVAIVAQSLGLKESIEPPKKIVVPTGTLIKQMN